MNVATSESYIPGLYADALALSRKHRGLISREIFRGAVLFTEVTADFFTCAAAIVTAHILHLHVGGYVPVPMQRVVAVGLLHGLFVVLLLQREGAYAGGSSLLGIRETECAMRTSLQSLLLLFVASFLLKLNFPTTALLLSMGLTPVLLMMEKRIFSSTVGILQAKGYGIDRVVVYGKVEAGKRITSSLLYSPRLGLNPVAVVGDGSDLAGDCMFGLGSRRSHSVPVQAGPITAALLQSLRCNLLIVAMPCAPLEKVAELMNIANLAGAPVAFLPSLAAEESRWAGSIDAHGLPPASTIGPIVPWHYAPAKRAVDLVVSSILIVLLCPFLAVIAVLIRVTSPGKALFVQKRVGRNGQLFDMYKFRSMYAGTPRYEVSPTHSSDPRITRLGRFLRRTSIDELPQLINVFLGSMSLVGPRPEMPFIVERYNHQQRQRLQSIPGITGLWQLSADRAFPIHENIGYDLYYVRNRTFFMDAAILMHTLLFAARGGV